MSDIGFLKTELNRTDMKIQKIENSFSAVWFSKTDISSLGTVIHAVSFTIYLAA